jgi:hypothetical protein
MKEEKEWKQETGVHYIKCSGCGFGCMIEFDSGGCVVPMRVRSVPCPFEALFWPEPKTNWKEMIVNENK